jgi:hypothetical protein
MNRDPKWLAVADRAYALALHLYPRAFRKEWGPQMRQAMRDRWREGAKQGRSAFGVSFALLPDLVASAGQQHLHAFGEEVAMKRMLLGSALVLSVGLFALQGRISTRVAAWQEATAARHRQTLLDSEVAYRAELRELALASRQPEVRALAWPLAQRISESNAGKLDSGHIARRVAADGNRLAEFLAAASCGDTAALARLQREEPENGAAWALTMTCALRSNDMRTARLGLVRLGQSRSYDSHSGGELAAATVLLKHAPSAAEHAPGTYGGDPGFLESLLWDMHRPEIEALRPLCGPHAIAGNAGLASDCRAAAAALSQADSRMIRQTGMAWKAEFDGRSPDPAVLRERHRAWIGALARWWALDDATRAARVAAGGNEIGLLRD